MKQLAILFLANYLIFGNRQSFPLIIPHLIKDGLSKQNIGTLSSAHSLASVLMTFPVGILSDKLGPKYVLILGMICAGSASIMFTMASTYGSYMWIHFANGLAMAFTAGTVNRLVRLISKPTQIATNLSIIMTAVNVVGILNPMINQFTMQLFGSWRISMAINAWLLIGIGCVLNFVVDNKSGSKKPSKLDKQKQQDNKKSSGSIRDLIKNHILWLCICSQTITVMNKALITQWGQLYFLDECHQDTYQASSFESLSNIGAVVSRFIVAWILDILVRRAINSTSSTGSYSMIKARLPALIALMTMLTFSMHLYNGYIGAETSGWFLALLAIAIGVCTSGIMLTVSVSMMEVDPDNAGLCQSIAVFSITLANIVNGLPVSMIASSYSWKTVFGLSQVLCGLVVVFQVYIYKLYLGKQKQD